MNVRSRWTSNIRVGNWDSTSYCRLGNDVLFTSASELLAIRTFIGYAMETKQSGNKLSLTNSNASFSDKSTASKQITKGVMHTARQRSFIKPHLQTLERPENLLRL